MKTIFSPRYIPRDKDIIYHYCNQESFLAICRNQSIWLSDILSMKDNAEFNWGREQVTEVLKKHKNEFTQDFRIAFITAIYSNSENVRPVLCSFSRNGTLLSQWNQYAQNGEGYAIGFSAKEIFEKAGINMNSIVYSPTTQKRILLNTIRGLFHVWSDNKKEFSEIAIALGVDLAYMKSPVFSEEQEIRIIRLLLIKGNGFTDPGGNSAFGKIERLPILQRTQNGKQVMHIALPLHTKGKSYIKEIILGPRNMDTIENLEDELKKIGITGINLKRHFN